MFTVTSVSKRMAVGEPALVAGKSGIEIVLDTVFEATGKILDILPGRAFSDLRSTGSAGLLPGISGIPQEATARFFRQCLLRISRVCTALFMKRMFPNLPKSPMIWYENASRIPILGVFACCTAALRKNYPGFPESPCVPFRCMNRDKRILTGPAPRVCIGSAKYWAVPWRILLKSEETV